MIVDREDGGIWQVARRRRRGRIPVNALAHEGLFLLLMNLRAANAASLFELSYKKNGVKHRTAMRRLKELVDAGCLAHLRLDGARCVYHLTPKSAALTPKLQERAHASIDTRPPDRQAMYCWLRSEIYAELTRAGWNVGNDAPALYALRRFNIDALEREIAAGKHAGGTASRTLEAMRSSAGLHLTDGERMGGPRWRCQACGYFRSRCKHEDPLTRAPCSGRFRADSVTRLDIAWKKSAAGYDVIVVFVDNPSRPLEVQLDELWEVCFLTPKLHVLVRSSDPRSRFDTKKRTFTARGDRHRALDKAFANDGRFDGAVVIVDPCVHLQAYPAR